MSPLQAAPPPNPALQRRESSPVKDRRSVPLGHATVFDRLYVCGFVT